MATVLYMPDGNKRFAEKKGLPLSEAYVRGGKTLKLLSEFFIAEGRASTLIYHAGSKYTHERTNSSPKSIYEAGIKTLNDLINEKFFENRGISFRAIDHSGKIPKDLTSLATDLFNSTKEGTNGEVILLLGYSLEEDFNQALSTKPKDYESLRGALLFPDIDLVIRPAEMRPSGGPVYAMSQSQMITLDKLNPEVARADLERVWEEYAQLKGYRESTNPIHQKDK